MWLALIALTVMLLGTVLLTVFRKHLAGLLARWTHDAGPHAPAVTGPRN